ncbi:MAG: bifunctional riboflavin kinase/FAD synthetase [Flavobacteriaceae bacterium]|nr:bifunctional riboflavin kinase/FAD synthetase [Flavobacteriaceae bacterium]
MKEYTSASKYSNSKGCVVTIGTFDGVHIGHKAILRRLVESARVQYLDSVLLTFFPHPRMVLQGDKNLRLLNTISEKKELIEATGVDHFVVHPFTKEFSRLTAVEYVRDILVNQLNAKKIIIGYDHRFGRNRTADISDLREFGETYAFEVEEISAQELDEVAVSSTKIRNALHIGDIATANKYLGYHFMLNGSIVSGKGIGKTLNYPTANLQIGAHYKLIPPKGVYLVRAKISHRWVYGLTSIGTNPTVGGTEQTIETFLMDFDDDLYHQNLCIEFITHIRDEETFNSTEELIQAIERDEKFARNFLASYDPTLIQKS